MKKSLLILMLVFTCLAQAETEFKIITLKHRFADDLLPTISPMVGMDGTATGVNNQLILRASPDRMRAIEATIAKLDTARANRKITVKTSNNVQSLRERIEANSKVKMGNVTISNDRRAKTNTANVDIRHTRTNTTQNSSQFLNVMDGQRAFIRVGHIIPYTQDWITITQRYVHISQTTDWHEISTGFAVRPRTIGNQVELEITPRIARINGQGYIDFEELSTIVLVDLGEWVDIGGTMQNQDDVSRKILGFRRSSSNTNSGLVIKVD